MSKLHSILRRLLLAAFLTAFIASGPARADTAAGAPFVLAEPVEGARLRGGQTAVLRWEAGVDLASTPGIEEWEAFLSFDGGTTFPLRITPHVDFDRRSVLWQVPNLPTSEGRLLFRFGNEREEREVLLPNSFRIERGEDPVFTPRRFGVGEPARAGAAGVVAWSEGDRTGRGSRAVEAAPLDAGLAGTRAPRVRADTHDECCEDTPGPASLAPPAAARLEPAPESPTRSASTLPSPAVGDILLLIQRRNE